jgi:predicted Zn-dependent peptidase
MLEAKQEPSRGYGYLDPQAVAAYVQPAAAGGAQNDIEQTLRKLADLRDQGLLSQAEFEAKKRELLSRI